MARTVVWDQQLDGSGPDTLSTIDGILKEDYVMENIVNTVNMATYLLSQLNEERTTAGRRYIFPVQFGVAEGHGARGENEDLPEEGWGEYDQAMGVVRFQYGTMKITGPSMAATEGGRASFASALKQALKDVRDGFKLDTQRQSWGDGTGTLAICDNSATSVTVAVTDPYGYTYSSADLDNSQKVRPFRRGMKLHFVTSGTSAVISSVNNDGTLTMATSILHAQGERIVRGDSSTSTSNNKEIEGIGKGVSDTGTYLGISRTGLPEWQANVIDMNGEDLDEDVMQSVFDTAEINGTDEPDTLICEHAVRRLYVSLLESQKRFANTTTLKGGFKALDYNGVPLVVDKNCPPQSLYYLRLADWSWYVMRQIGWMNEDGTILKWTGQDSFKAVLRAYRNLACKKPSNQTVLTGIVS